MADAADDKSREPLQMPFIQNAAPLSHAAPQEDRVVTCRFCRGQGTVPCVGGSNYDTCPTCNGSGVELLASRPSAAPPPAQELEAALSRERENGLELLDDKNSLGAQVESLQEEVADLTASRDALDAAIGAAFGVVQRMLGLEEAGDDPDDLVSLMRVVERRYMDATNLWRASEAYRRAEAAEASRDALQGELDEAEAYIARLIHQVESLNEEPV